MKTRKQCEAVRRIAGLIAIAIMATAIIGCKGDDDTTTGGTQEQPPVDNSIGSVTIGGKSIKVYKADGVSEADAATTLTTIKTAFVEISDTSTGTYIVNNVEKIEIGGDGVTLNEKLLMIKTNINKLTLKSNLNTLAATSLGMKLDNSRKTARMALLVQMVAPCAWGRRTVPPMTLFLPPFVRFVLVRSNPKGDRHYFL